MKLIVVSLVGLFLLGVNAFPARDIDDDTEIVVIPLERQHNIYQREPEFNNFQGVIDTGYGDGYYPTSGYYTPVSQYNPFSWNFGRFFESFEDVLRRMRDQVSTAWSNSPRPGIVWSEVPEGKGNTTSTVKIVDGHKVIINDTVYKQESEFGTSIVKVRVIDVKPLDEEVGTNAPETIPKDVEQDISIQTKIDAESVDAKTDHTVNDGKEDKEDKEEKEDKEDKDDKENNSEVLDKGSPEELDSTNDNEISKEIDEPSEVENFEIMHQNNEMHQNYDMHQYKDTHEFYYPDLPYSNWDSSFENDETNEEINDIDIDDHHRYPIDLSNDIAVNQILANQGAAYNPNAEIFSVEEQQPMTSSLSSSGSSLSSLTYQLPPSVPIK